MTHFFLESATISHGDSLAERAAIDEGQLRTLFSVAVFKNVPFSLKTFNVFFFSSQTTRFLKVSKQRVHEADSSVLRVHPLYQYHKESPLPY